MPLNRRTHLACAIALAGLASGAQAESLLPNLQLNGYATAGGTMVTNDFGGNYLNDGYSIEGFNEDGNFQFDNVLGLQVTYQASEKFDLVGQLVSSGQKNYDTYAEWAYVAYRHNDSLRLRAGRFAAPFYMYSESLRVGQAYPWARTPIELYFGIPTKSLDGLDVQYRIPLGDWNFDAQGYFGGSTEAFGRIKKTAGLNLNLSNSSLTLHAGYGAGKIDLEFSGNLEGPRIEQFEGLLNAFGGTMDTSDETVTFADIGAIYDDGNWFAAAEFGQLRIEDYANNFDAGYFSVGHYFGKWLPYTTFSKSNAVEAEGCYSRFNPTLAYANTQAATATAGAASAAAAVTAANAAVTAANANVTAAATTVTNAATLLATDNTNPEYQLAYATAVINSNNAQLNAGQAAAMATQAGLLASEVAALATEANYGAGMLSAGLQSVCNGKEQTSYTLGFRYDATKNISIKAEVSHVRDGLGFFSSPNQQLQDQDSQVITFNVNAAF